MSRAGRLAAVAVFLVALVLHGVIWLQYRTDPFATLYIADAQSYHEWALRMLERGLAAEPAFHQAPLFPLLLSATYAVAGEARDAWAAWLQLLLSSLAIALLVPIGRAYFRSTAVGIAAAALALAHAPFVFYALKLLPVSLALATQGLGLLTLGLARGGARLPLAAVAGLCWGAACLARSEMLLFAPPALAALWWTAEPSVPQLSPARRARPLALFAAALALVVAPALLHNLRTGGGPVVAVSGGENLFIGNQRSARGGYRPLAPGAAGLFAQRAAAREIAERESGRPLEAGEVSAFWRRRAGEEIRADPAGWLALEARKLGRTLHPGDPTDLYSLAVERAHYLTALHAMIVSPWALLLLALAGGWIARAQRRRLWPICALAAVQLSVLLLFFVDGRLRLPLYYALVPFAGFAIVEGLRAWRDDRNRATVAVVAAATLGLCLWGGVATRARPRDVVRAAAVLSAQQRFDESLQILAPLLSASAPDPIALDQAGWVLQQRGEIDAARESYVRAIDRGLPESREHQTRTRLAEVLERLGRFDEAGLQHGLAVASEHANPGSWFQRGMFLVRRGDAARGAEDLRRALALAPSWPPPREALHALGYTD